MIAANKRRNRALIILLASLATLVAFSIDIYLPAVPGLVRYFSSNMTMVQLTISLFLLGYSVGQLFYGPFSDRFGRRITLLISLSIYLVMTILCLFAQSIDVLIVFRFFQAIGACGAVVIVFAMVRDLFPAQERIKIYAYLTLAISISPVLAPIVGSYLNHWFGWRSTFVFLSVFGLLLLLGVYWMLNETNQHLNTSAFNRFFGNYKLLLGHREFLIYVLCSSGAFAALFSFISTSSFIFIDMIGIPKQYFGYYFSVVTLTLMLGSYLTSRLTKYFHINRLILAGAILIFLSGLVLSVISLTLPLGRLDVMLPMAVAVFGVAIVMPTSTSGFMAPFSQKAGAASGLSGFIRFVIAGIIGTVATFFLHNTALPLGVALMVSGGLILSVLMLG